MRRHRLVRSRMEFFGGKYILRMMIAVVEIRYLLLDGNWKAMTLQEVLEWCAPGTLVLTDNEKVSSTFYRFVLCRKEDEYY